MAGSVLNSTNFIEREKEESKNYGFALGLMVTLFFVFGIITVLNDILIPHFKSIFQLTYGKAMLINGFFFGAYFIMGIPSSIVIDKLGYKKAIVVGLCIVGLGCLSFYPASLYLSYYLFLASLFLIASGITLLQVAANAYVTVLGPPEKSSARISLCGGLNSTATIIGPIIGASMILNQGLFNQVEYKAQVEYNLNEKTEQLMSMVTPMIGKEVLDSLINNQEKVRKYSSENIDSPESLESNKVINNHNNATVALKSAELALGGRGEGKEELKQSYQELKISNEAVALSINTSKAEAVPLPYIFLGGFVLIIAFIFSKVNLPEIINKEKKNARDKYSALSFKHLRLGIIAIFLYVGAEVVVGSLLINYIGLTNILGLAEKEAAIYVTLYWGSAAIARFIGFFVLQKVKPAQCLTFVSVIAALMITNSIFTDGWLSLSTMIAVGLCHSVMWPVIFSLSLEGLGKYKTQGSGLLIMGVVGGAFIPILQGAMADTVIGLQNSFVITVACYLYLIYYGLLGYKNISPLITNEIKSF